MIIDKNSYEEFKKKMQELEAENARLRQQRDAANAQLDFLVENGYVPKVVKSNMDEVD